MLLNYFGTHEKVIIEMYELYITFQAALQTEKQNRNYKYILLAETSELELLAR
jgi:hypothetical protein